MKALGVWRGSHYDFSGERGGLNVESLTPDREVGGSIPTTAVLCPSADSFTPQKVLVIPTKGWLRPVITERLLTDLKHQHKQTNKHYDFFSSENCHFYGHNMICPVL